jgi:hypothetical protein
MNRRSSGSVVAMALILSTIGIILIAALWQLFAQTQNTQGTRRAHPHWSWFVQTIRNNIEDPVSCTQLMSGQVVHLGNNVVTVISLNRAPLNIPDNSNQMGGSIRFRTASLRLRPVPPATGAASRIRFVRSADPSVGAGSNGLYASWEAVMVFQANARDGAPPPNLDQADYRISLILNLRPNLGPGANTGAATIMTCGIKGSILEACEQLGGFYDPRPTPFAADPESRCLPYRKSNIMPCPASVNPPFSCNNGLWRAPVGTVLPSNCNANPLNPVRYFPNRIGLDTSSSPQQLMFQCRWDNPNIPSGGDPTP